MFIQRRGAAPASFMGIVRPDGRVPRAIYIAILSSVNCSATVSRAIADRFRRDIFPDALAPYPNVDGVIALTHGTGCGMDMGESMQVLRRTMAGYARHPNVAAVIFVGLGCEANQITSLFGAEDLHESDRIARYNMQDVGGTAKAIERGVALVQEMLPAADRIERTPMPESHLTLGLQCGGRWLLRITANPALGNAVGLLVARRHGQLIETLRSTVPNTADRAVTPRRR
jgi:altronate hydrolase